MKILHTADWHLGDRLGRIDRTEDLRRAVERVAAYCEYKDVEVLIVAGDLFSELSRPDSLRASIEHMQEVFRPFLLRGGTILAVTGNHDNETFCQTLRLVMTLAAPATDRPGELCPTGRLYLATNPTFLRLKDRAGAEVQFILMPYPTPTRYLREEEAQRYASLEEKNRHLQAAYTRRLNEVQQHPDFRPSLPTVLAAHVHVQGARLPTLFRMSEQESIVFSEEDLPTHFAYIALGHIHQPQCLRGLSHVRYSSSIERLDLGERRDDKGVVLVEVGPGGRRGEPEFLPLPATSLYEVELHTPLRPELDRLRREYPGAARDLVQIRFTYKAGEDNLEDTLKELEEIFPRWYNRDWTEAGALTGSLTGGVADRTKSFEDTVRDYLTQELAHHPEPDRQAVLGLVEDLLKEVQV